MRHTATLLRQCIRVTLFTRENCSLCTEAKDVLSKVWDRRPFEYDEVDVMAARHQKWKAIYEFDTPVVHVDGADEGQLDFSTTASARKLMHRFREDEVEKLMDESMKADDGAG